MYRLFNALHNSIRISWDFLVVVVQHPHMQHLNHCTVIQQLLPLPCRVHFEFAVISLMLLHCPRVIHAGMECLRVSALLSRVIALVIGRTPPKPETIVAPFSWTWSVARHHAMKAWKIVYYIGIYTFWHMYIISYVWVCIYLSHIHSHTHT